MLTLSLHHLLELFESHLTASGEKAKATLLHFTENNLSIGGSPEQTFRNLYADNRFEPPLSASEEKRFLVLNRKAQGGWLSEQEDTEFESLIQIRRYHEVKESYPHWTHQQILDAILF